jgi:hypothetical protein
MASYFFDHGYYCARVKCIAGGKTKFGRKEMEMLSVRRRKCKKNENGYWDKEKVGSTM